MDYQVVTFMNAVSADSHLRPDRFFESCRRYSVNPVVLGFNQPWPRNRIKINLLRTAILDKTLTAPILLIADAFDVVFAAHPARIASSFATTGHPIICNAETSCFPPIRSNARKHPKSASRLRYLNSGFILGRLDAIHQCLTAMEHLSQRRTRTYPDDDQILWQLVFLDGAPIHLDTEARFCLACFQLTPDDLTSNNGSIKFGAVAPMAFHFNGVSKWEPIADVIVKRLGY